MPYKKKSFFYLTFFLEFYNIKHPIVNRNNEING